MPVPHDERNLNDDLTPIPPDPLDDLLALTEDYFPPLPPRPAFNSRPTVIHTAPGHRPTLSQSTSVASLSAQPTTAISLPEGVYAQQQDGVSSGHASGSVTTAPSFSDAASGNSRKSVEPTMKVPDDADVESMIGEILGDEESWLVLPEPLTICESESESDDDADSEASEASDRDSDDDSIPEETRLQNFRSHRKHFLILSSAGKPIYSRHGTTSLLIPYLGVISALTSSFPPSSGQLQSFTLSSTTFHLLSLPPLILLTISTLHPPEPPSLLLHQLHHLHSSILSTLTLPTLTSAFSHGRSNFDLRRLLGGTTSLLDTLCDTLPHSPSILLNALESLFLRATTRKLLHSTLLQHRTPSLLYGMLLAPHRLIAVIRPQRHSLNPSDLQLLFNMLFNTPSFSDLGSEHWVPICLPKFNNRGFLHCYIQFFRPGLAMVLVSANKEAFFEMREMAGGVLGGVGEGVWEEVGKAVERYESCEGGRWLRHWVCRSRREMQITMPRVASKDGMVKGGPGRKTVGMYRALWKEVAGGKGKVVYLKDEDYGDRGGENEESGSEDENESVKRNREKKSKAGREAMAWVGNGWEVYAVGKRGVGREGLVRAIREVVRWVNKNEERVWVTGGATF